MSDLFLVTFALLEPWHERRRVSLSLRSDNAAVSDTPPMRSEVSLSQHPKSCKPQTSDATTRQVLVAGIVPRLRRLFKNVKEKEDPE